MKRNSIYQRIFRITLITFLTIVILLSITTLLFYIYKDDISRAILRRVNDVQKGELSIENISFSPFAQFPSISLKLNNVLLVLL